MSRVYKVTNSINCSAIDSLFSLRYSSVYITFPEVGKIFAFNSIETAKEAIRKLCWSNKLIWEAEADVFKTENVRIATYKRDIEGFWGSGPGERGECAPKGTVSCNSIKLIALIGEYNGYGEKK